MTTDKIDIERIADKLVRRAVNGDFNLYNGDGTKSCIGTITNIKAAVVAAITQCVLDAAPSQKMDAEPCYCAVCQGKRPAPCQAGLDNVWPGVLGGIKA
jgi:hypothetical protein